MYFTIHSETNLFITTMKVSLFTVSSLNFSFLLICPQTMLTAISMSAIATNGVVPGRMLSVKCPLFIYQKPSLSEPFSLRLCF